ncbi:hypothetical protein F2P79_009934 [Pimephales promelas]|nr:hypothetical protein F2P79_009934 [Pimephales promelas]
MEASQRERLFNLLYVDVADRGDLMFCKTRQCSVFPASTPLHCEARIQLFGNLSIHPGCSFLHYAAQVCTRHLEFHLKQLLSPDCQKSLQIFRCGTVVTRSLTHSMECIKALNQIGHRCASSAIQQTIAMSVKEPWGISTSRHYHAPGHASAKGRSHSLAVQKS